MRAQQSKNTRNSSTVLSVGVMKVIVNVCTSGATTVKSLRMMLSEAIM
jgi:hypothetical protein